MLFPFHEAKYYGDAWNKVLNIRSRTQWQQEYSWPDKFKTNKWKQACYNNYIVVQAAQKEI